MVKLVSNLLFRIPEDQTTFKDTGTGWTDFHLVIWQPYIKQIPYKPAQG